MVLRFSRDAVDQNALDEWCGRLELSTLLEQAENFDPDG